MRITRVPALEGYLRCYNSVLQEKYGGTVDETRQQPVGTLVARHPEWARVLEGFGIDYCCGGADRLEDACARAGTDVDQVVTALAVVPSGDAPCPPLVDATVDDIVEHLIDPHHTYMWRELPRLDALVTKIREVHGERHPELAEVAATFAALHSHLEMHLRLEEGVLFPLCRAVATPHATDADRRTLVETLRTLLVEHDEAGESLAQLSRLTGSYAVPADGCATYEAAMIGLAAMADDLHRHIHEENNILFPAVQARAVTPGAA